MHITEFFLTSRVRHKSASRLRLKNSQRISRREVFSSIVPEKPGGGSTWRAERVDHLGFFLPWILSQSIKKLKGDPLRHLKNFEKVSQHRKKSKGDPLISSGFVCYAEKKETTIIVQFPGSNGTIWPLKIL